MDPHRQFDRPYGQPDPPSRSRYAPRPGETHYPTEEASSFHASPTEATGQWLGPPGPVVGRPEPAASVYRARRPAVAAVLIVAAVVAGLLFLRGLAIAAFGDESLIGAVIASTLALASLPLVCLGLYALITGAARGAEQWGFRVWARPPLAYLLVGLAFLAAAGLAIS